MSSNFERKSLDRLKEQSRQQLQTAAEVVPCVTVTEKNWSGMIGLQQAQIQLLVEIQTAAAQLVTREELVEYLDQRVQQLENHSMEMQSVAQNFRQRMEQSADEITKNLSSQAGRISTESLFGAGENEQIHGQAVLGSPDSFGSAGDIGIDLAYLSADVAGIINEDYRPQDSTIMKKQKRKKRALGQKPDEQDHEQHM